jgi:hypothetical protein
MAGRAVTDTQWERLREQLPQRKRRQRGGRLQMIASVLKAFCGSYGRARHGASGPSGRIQRALSIVGLKHGPNRACC